MNSPRITRASVLRPLALAACFGAAVGLSAPSFASAQDSAPNPQSGERAGRELRGQRRGEGRGHGHGRRGMHRPGSHGPGSHGPGSHGPGRGTGMHGLLRQLDLTDAQRVQLREIHEGARANMEALRESGDHEAMHRAMRDVWQRTRRILTPAQTLRLQTLERERETRFVEHRLTRMTAHLSLSTTQSAQIRSILLDAGRQRRALMEAASLDENDPRDAMRALHERTEAAIVSVLNSEQAAQFNEHRARRGEGHPRRFGRGFGPGHGEGRGAGRGRAGRPGAESDPAPR